MWRLFLLLAAAAFSDSLRVACATDSQEAWCTNPLPLIGILTQPGSPAKGTDSYIAASYVKFTESGGARVVPILHDTPAQELEQLLQQLNGAIIPGGGQDLSPGHSFFDTVDRLLQHAIAAGDQGDYWPLWGTCLGFEALAVAVSKNTTILGRYKSLNLPSAIAVPTDIHGRLLKGLPADVLQDMQTQPLIFQNHENGIDAQRVIENPKLHAFVKILGYSSDRQGMQYVSMFEAEKYPIYAVQFHPEKNAYEFAPFLDIPHSARAVAVTAAFAQFLVSEARCSLRAPRHPDEADKMLIYNHPAVYTGEARQHGIEADFEQCYFFPPWSEQQHLQAVSS